MLNTYCPYTESFRLYTGSNCTNRFKPIKRLSGLLVILTLTAFGVGCTPSPPDHRAQVTAPVYKAGDSTKGEKLYEDLCSQCHTLRPGSNKKGPQLVGVYMAPSAQLKDYKYSEALNKAHWIWDAKTLDSYIADPKSVLADTRMLSDPVPNAQDRQDIIAYLSTLGRDPLPVTKDSK
ncbi:c-type cytochrome [Psychrobacter sp.]|uniref:c-type cytochrome n=1 Tax=Psychrobacter sp. TaxID=56811 RepID=UPI0025D81B1C|nr:c-type cytochrome [Psychrobacter sp.]